MEDKSTKKQVPATFWLGVLAKSPTIEVNGKSVSGVQPYVFLQFPTATGANCDSALRGLPLFQTLRLFYQYYVHVGSSFFPQVTQLSRSHSEFHGSKVIGWYTQDI